MAFCQSADDQIQVTHIAVSRIVATLSKGEQRSPIEHVASLTRRLSERTVDLSDAIPLGHDGYLNLWAFSRPTIACVYIMLNEAQVTDAVVMHALAHQQACRV